jgi:hypothetical protein
MPTSYIERVEPVDPHQRRWMMFVDGENLVIRAQQVARDKGVSLPKGPLYSPDVFVWLPDWVATRAFVPATEYTVPLQPHAVRAHYYTSLAGAEEKIRRIREALFELGFTPKVFKRSKTRGSKAVDITLATDMLAHGYRDNYDVAFLLGGDGDYVPLVEEVKRLGKVVYCSFFRGSGLSKDLQLASDTFFYLDELFLGRWKQELGTS